MQRPRLYAVCGASGSGKTTLARAVAARTGVAYHDGSFGRIAKTLGCDPVAPSLSMDARIDIQHRVLAAFLAEIDALTSDTIMDRAPLDMIGYMLAEVSMHSGGTNTRAVLPYVEMCLDATASRFTGIVIVRPLDSYETASHRPPENDPYHWHVQTLIEGALPRMTPAVSAIIIETIDHEERFTAASRFVLKQARQTATYVVDAVDPRDPDVSLRWAVEAHSRAEAIELARAQVDDLLALSPGLYPEPGALAFSATPLPERRGGPRAQLITAAQGLDR